MVNNIIEARPEDQAGQFFLHGFSKIMMRFTGILQTVDFQVRVFLKICLFGGSKAKKIRALKKYKLICSLKAK